MTRVNCEEYAHGHEMSKLLGSPPGYVGSHIEPLLSQERIDGPHRRLRRAAEATPGERIGLADEIDTTAPNRNISIILFDEIEKAHPTVWSALLGILEDGMLTLGDNTTTDFTHSIILMTSNVGSREMGEFLEHRPVGFRGDFEDAKSDADSVSDLALEAAIQEFPFEFLNRFDEILAYSALNHAHLEAIFDKFLVQIHERALVQAGVPLLIKISPAAKDWIIDHGTDLRFGARPLRRAMERELVDPLSRFIASHKVSAGDVVDVELESEGLTFYRRLAGVEALIV